MHSIGIAKARWVLLRQNKTICVERRGDDEQLPTDVLSIKNLRVVTGLDGSSIIRRDLKLSLKNLRTVKAALPFQLEPLLPFSLDQSIIYPELHPTKNETVVVAWATTRSAVQSHLEKWKAFDPDLISSETIALARWARHHFPEEPQIVVVDGKLGVALDRDVIVCAMESSDPERLKIFLKQKYPFYHWVECADPFAVPFGLALEPLQKNPCQFRPKGSISERQKKREKAILKKTLMAGVSLTVATWLISQGIFWVQEKKILSEIGSGKSLVEATEQFRSHIIHETKKAPLVYELPTMQDVLAWLSSLSAPVDIQHFEYDISGQVSIEFQAEKPSDADAFVKKLQETPTLVEPTSELKWNSHIQGYRLSFLLRKR